MANFMAGFSLQRNLDVASRNVKMLLVCTLAGVTYIGEEVSG